MLSEEDVIQQCNPSLSLMWHINFPLFIFLGFVWIDISQQLLFDFTFCKTKTKSKSQFGCNARQQMQEKVEKNQYIEVNLDIRSSFYLRYLKLWKD